MTSSLIETAPAIEPFDPLIDNAYDIAQTHLSIRRWQEAVGQNSFSNIYESQADLMGLETYYIEPGGNFFVARDIATQRAIGFVGLRNDGEGIGKIKRLAVEPPYQRKGIGRALTSKVIDWATSNDFSKLTLQTHYFENAAPLYEEFGFTIEGFDRDRFDCLMELELGKAS
jgi:GNAT superfamily N-acetyltransferase